MVPHGVSLDRPMWRILPALTCSSSASRVSSSGVRLASVCVLVAQLAEEIGAALRPVQLVEVDVVGLQALEAGVHGFGDVLAVVSQVFVADVVDGVAGAGDLAGQDPVGAIAAAFEVIADVALGGGVGFGLGRHRVHLGGVDEIDPGALGPFDLGEGFSLAVLLAPGHGSEADGAHVQIGSA